MFKKNTDITYLSNFKTKARAKFYFEINNISDLDKLKEIFLYIENNNLNYLFIWLWTNLLFAFDIFEWVIIKNNLVWWNYDNENKILESYSSENISDIAKVLEKKYNQNLFHRFIWLPWTIWWAVFWNAWCFWLEVSNNFLDASMFNIDTKKIEKLYYKDMNFWYRSSILKETWKYFIISARFALSEKKEKYSSDVDNVYFREYKQPKWNTCWSFFKNPSKEKPAWSLIEKVWLKWYKVWWAYFSDLHANFLMSDWNTSYNDLINLIELSKKKVKEKFNIDLIPEVRIITNK